MWESHLIRLLKSRFEAAAKKNPGFSLRAFARRIGLSPGALSEIMRRKRGISAERALDIVDRLGLEDAELARFRHLVLRDNADSRMLLSAEAFKLISRWYYSAIISLFNLDQPPQNTEEIAETLALDLETAKEAVERLIDYHLLHRDEDGRVSATGQHFITKEDVPSEIVCQAHREGLELAARALNQYGVGEREFTSIVFDASKDSLREGKNEIRRFRDNLTEIMQSSDRDTVYRLNIQLFPLTKPKAKPE
jgi:transcriptional regulator with XRE-family HTH domain